MCLNLTITGSDTNGGGSFARGLYGSSLQRKATAIARCKKLLLILMYASFSLANTNRPCKKWLREGAWLLLSAAMLMLSM